MAPPGPFVGPGIGGQDATFLRKTEILWLTSLPKQSVISAI